VSKKSIALIGLNIFLFESRATFLKLLFDSEQVWMDEKLVTILRFEIQSSAFVFLNL